jgi:CspA family cold shock protein
MPKGTIKTLTDRGFGFIQPESGGGDIFFHRNDLEGVEFNSLRKGQEVEFEKGQESDGRPRAVKVKLAEAREEKIEQPVQLEEEITETQASDDGGDDQGGGEGEV